MRNVVYVAVDIVIISAMYCGLRLAVERVREKRDWQNATYAGGLTGGLLGARGGVKVSMIGAATFAALATAIEYGVQKMA